MVKGTRKRTVLVNMKSILECLSLLLLQIWWEHQDVKVILIALFGAGFLSIKYGRGWN